MTLPATVIAWRRIAFAFTAFVVLTAALFIFGGEQSAEANASVSTPAAVGGGTTFPGTGTGPIPDGNTGTPPQFGTPLVVNFNVSGLTAPVTDVTVNFTATHSWVGDVDVVLTAPGGSPSIPIVSRIGVITATGFGDSSNYGGTYVFSDTAMGTNIWTVATDAGCGDTCSVAAGTYRSTAAGGAGQTNPPPVTNITATFAGLSTAQINGTWTLRFRDAAQADTGSVTAANLTITGSSGPIMGDGPLDYDGDGTTDYAVVRNIGGGSTGQLRWFIDRSSGGPTLGYDWGLATDFVIAGDFDGDGKDDVSVWRPGSAGTAAFYILNSATNTARIEAFGQTGDNPVVVGDYNGDGKTDIAVYRAGATANDQSVFYYRVTPEGPTTFVPWGIGTDFVAVGDYDGDGKHDFGVQRASGGSGIFYILRSSDSGATIRQFGLSTDLIVPGDYDGDGKTDIAVVRASGGGYTWYYLSSSTGAASQVNWGLSTDILVPGDYNGDGRSDYAIWRDGTFWILNSATFATKTHNLGSPGDYPVANFVVQ